MNNEELYRGIYRVKSIRLPHWNYSSNGEYFVTICTQNRMEYFGEVRNNIMGLSDIGCMVVKYWQEIPNHFNNVKLDEWIIMPNHLHGILVIENKKNWSSELHNNKSPRRDVALQRLYECGNNKYNRNPKNQFFSKISPKPKSLSVIIRSFKSIITKMVNQKYPEINFMWPFGLELMVERQPRFYEHIIRNDDALYEICEYIKYNPYNWEQDRNNIKNLANK